MVRHVVQVSGSYMPAATGTPPARHFWWNKHGMDLELCSPDKPASKTKDEFHIFCTLGIAVPYVVG